MNRFATLAAVALMTVILVACSGAPTSPSAVGSPTASPSAGFTVSDGQSPRITGLAADDEPISSSDNAFIGSAAATHQAMINWAQLAEKSSAHSRVKFFAQQMFQENTEGLARLRQSQVWRSSVPQPISLSAAHSASLSSLSGVTGNPMDRAYTDLMTAELPAFIAQLQAWSRSAASRALGDHWADLATRLSTYIDILRETTARVH